jgi:hypothetical protein
VGQNGGAHYQKSVEQFSVDVILCGRDVRAAKKNGCDAFHEFR